eukprot:11906908-Ditylum_brightwellii.AAC.1
MEQIMPNLMRNNGTETQQSAGIGLVRDDEDSTISNDWESSWMMETQQTAGIGQEMGQKDQALHVLFTWSKLCQTQYAMIPQNQTISRDRTGDG